jgi:hypothetical protein
MIKLEDAARQQIYTALEAASIPEPHVRAAEIADDLRAALEQFEAHVQGQTQEEWPPIALLRLNRSERALMAALREKGGCLAWIGEETPELLHLELLGALVSSDGRLAERLLTEYLEYLRQVSAENPLATVISASNIKASLELDDAELHLLGRLIFLDQLLQRGGSGGTNWQANVPDSFQSYAAIPDPNRFLRHRLLSAFDPGTPIRKAEQQAYRNRIGARSRGRRAQHAWGRARHVADDVSRSPPMHPSGTRGTIGLGVKSSHGISRRPCSECRRTRASS